MTKVIFYNRNFTGVVPLRLDIEIERYSHAMIGGPDTAALKVRTTADKWELVKLLRCPVEIYGNDGSVKWWGYVNRVVVPHGKIRIGLGLDALHNSLSVKYADATTSISLDTQSVSEYGTKEFFINLPGATVSEAEAYRNTYLESHKYAMAETELSGGQDEIVIECYGWWRTLSWKYFTEADTAAIENTTQITDIVTACGQFLNGVVIENVSGLTSVPTRDGSNNGMAYITELLNAGSSNARPMLAYVDKNRYLHVYERVAETTEYILREDGRLETLLGRLVEEESCISAVWVRAKGVPDALGGMSSMRPFFIERAEYVGRTTHYTSADAFAQKRLDQYIADIANSTFPSGYSGGTYGSPPVSPPPASGGVRAAMFGNYNSASDTLTGSNEDATIDTEFFDDIGLTLSGNRISGFDSGYYLVTAMLIMNGSGTEVNWNINVDDIYEVIENKLEFDSPSGVATISGVPNITLSGTTYIDAGASVGILIQGDSTPGSLTLYVDNLSFVQLNTTAAAPP